MEKRFHRRIRDLVARLASSGLDANEIGCVRISMMARSNTLRSTGRIQMRETSNLLIDQIQLATHGWSIQTCQKRTCRFNAPYRAQPMLAQSNECCRHFLSEDWHVCGHAVRRARLPKETYNTPVPVPDR